MPLSEVLAAVGLADMSIDPITMDIIEANLRSLARPSNQVCVCMRVCVCVCVCASTRAHMHARVPPTMDIIKAKLRFLARPPNQECVYACV